MAMNPQSQFDEDWYSWPEEVPQATSPIAGTQASIEWGVANVRTLFAAPRNPPPAQARAPDESNRGIARGRGHLRKNVPTNNGHQNEFQPTGRAIVGRSSEERTHDSLFSFNEMSKSLCPEAAVGVSGDINTQPTPSATNFSFRETVANTNNGNNTAFVEVMPSNSQDYNIDGQCIALNDVLQVTRTPMDMKHFRKLCQFRQDPNHPLYSVTTFENLNLKEELKTGLSADHKCKLSGIQEKTLPALNSPPYRNCIAQSQNGTGKTIAFVVTMLNRVDFSRDHVQAVCLLPTKELAQQVVETTHKLGAFFPNIQENVFSATKDSKQPTRVVAHEALLNDRGKLRTPIVIGTAGTVNSLMRKTRQLEFDGVFLFVVDEADKMLERASENFYTTIENIVKRLSPYAQRVFFSATFSDDVVEEAKKFMDNPLTIRLRDEDLSLNNIAHYYLRVRNREDKLEAMKLIYNSMGVGQSIVFCRTRHMSHWLCGELRGQLDFKVAELSGDMEPRDRDEQISRFRHSADRVLVTTNLSARGLDIRGVNLIINWDPPIIHETKTADFDTYLHRVGRSGRFGADGVAVNMVEKETDLLVFKQIERHFNITIEELSSHYKDMDKTLRKDYE